MSSRRNPWQTLQQKNVYENPWIRIEHHDVINLAGKPGIYGKVCFKTRAVVQRVVLTNDYRANDSDASEFNSDTDSAMKTKARLVNAPDEVVAGTPVPLTGIALVGISGLSKVQYCVRRQDDSAAAPDLYGLNEDWKDAAILPPPLNWGAALEGGRLPTGTHMFDRETGAPLEWPMRFSIAHWAALLAGLSAGTYEICCRTIDGNGIAQPIPRPLPRTGANALHRVTLKPFRTFSKATPSTSAKAIRWARTTPAGSPGPWGATSTSS